MVKTTQTYTWQEIVKHTSPEDTWVYSSRTGFVYDITEWLPKHPGGRRALLMAAGRDITYLLEANHLQNNPWSVLEKYKIGCIKGRHKTPKFVEDDSGFHKELRRRVNEYFVKTGKDPLDGVPSLIIGLVALVCGAICFYGANHPGVQISWSTRVLASMLLAAFVASLGTLGHMTSHFAITHSKPLQENLSIFIWCTIVGWSRKSWEHWHNIGHHGYTNIIDADPDVNGFDPLRVHDKQPPPSLPFQHIIAAMSPLVFSPLSRFRFFVLVVE